MKNIFKNFMTMVFGFVCGWIAVIFNPDMFKAFVDALVYGVTGAIDGFFTYGVWIFMIAIFLMVMALGESVIGK